MTAGGLFQNELLLLLPLVLMAMAVVAVVLASGCPQSLRSGEVCKTCPFLLPAMIPDGDVPLDGGAAAVIFVPAPVPAPASIAGAA
jgi:hypothetical protein